MSQFNVYQFIERLTGGSRPNQFEVLIDSPDGSINNEETRFLVSAATLPGQSIGTASVLYRGREVKLAGDKTFAPWSTVIK
jgi:hypothetical protein